MTNEFIEHQPVFSHAEPVLAVKDIGETLQYWQDVLGFPAQWAWGDPPNHAGVSWQKIFIQFTLNPELAAASTGNSIWIRVKYIDALYHFHQRRGAVIIEPLANQPWGMAQYTVREVNGYYLHFADAIREHQESAAHLPVGVRIKPIMPSAKEYAALMSSVGWASSMNEEESRLRLEAALHGVIAEDTVSKQVIGCGLILGDRASFFYVKDLMVHPNWQHKRIGTALMKELTSWIENNAADKSLVALISNETLESFYQQFGFTPAFSMIKYIHRK